MEWINNSSSNTRRRRKQLFFRAFTFDKTGRRVRVATRSRGRRSRGCGGGRCQDVAVAVLADRHAVAGSGVVKVAHHAVATTAVEAQIVVELENWKEKRWKVRFFSPQSRNVRKTFRFSKGKIFSVKTANASSSILSIIECVRVVGLLNGQRSAARTSFLICQFWFTARPFYSFLT